MSVLPSYHGRDQELQYLFKLIDERLSEALSIHGRQTLRQGTKLFDTTNKTPETDQTYSANTLFAWAYSDANAALSGVSIIAGVNLTAEKIGVGNYRYKFINSPKYSVVLESPQVLAPIYLVLPFVVGPWGAALPGVAMVSQNGAAIVNNLNVPGYIYVSSRDINSFELTAISTNTWLAPAIPPTWTLNDTTHGVIVLAAS